jgi:hypothetical protein
MSRRGTRALGLPERLRLFDGELARAVARAWTPGSSAFALVIST